MGIRFVDSILMLLTAGLGVATAYFVGHGLSEWTAWPWITAAACLLGSFLVGMVTIRRIRRTPDRGGTSAH
jgi:fluoride ion exporter CrcB/FEX